MIVHQLLDYHEYRVSRRLRASQPDPDPWKKVGSSSLKMNSGPTELPAEEIDPEEQQQLHDPRVRTHPLHARLLAIPGPHSNIIHTPDKETSCRRS